MKNKLTLTFLISVFMLTAAWAVPNASTPVAGQTYYIYNVAKRLYLADNGSGTATLSAGGTAVTLTEADNTTGTLYLTTAAGNISTGGTILTPLSDIKTDGTGRYSEWMLEETGNGHYRIASRTDEANIFMYMTWSDFTNRLTTTPWQPGDIFYNGQWILVAENDYTENIVVFDEQADCYTAPAVDGAATVHLMRTLTLNSWNSLCVPFNISNTQLKLAFGNDVRVAEFTGCYETTLFFTSAQGVTAGTPYLIFPTKGQAEGGYYEFTGVTAFSADNGGATTHAPVTYSGFFYKATAPQGAYVLRKNEVYHLQSDMAMKGFRAYFYEENGASAIKEWKLDNGTTAIDGITENESNAPMTGSVYSVSGQKMERSAIENGKAAPGVYIINGKKVVVK